MQSVPITIKSFNPAHGDTTVCDKVCQWLAVFSGYPFSFTNKIDHRAEILLKVALNTITLTDEYGIKLQISVSTMYCLLQIHTVLSLIVTRTAQEWWKVA